jgi:hypothetical protein
MRSNPGKTYFERQIQPFAKRGSRVGILAPLHSTARFATGNFILSDKHVYQPQPGASVKTCQLVVG